MLSLSATRGRKRFTMKKIQREETKVIYTDIYVSVDGKEFTNEEDCRRWENSYNGTLEASWKLINKKGVCGSDFGISWCCDDHECYIVKPKSIDEIILINAYIESSTSNKGTLTTNDVGKLLLLNFGYDHDWCDVHILADVLKNITDRIEKVEIEMAENA